MIKDIYMVKSVDTPTGMKNIQEAGLSAFAFLLVKAMSVVKVTI